MEYKLLIIHGFNSSPQSYKAQLTIEYMAKKFPNVEVFCPQLKSTPIDAVEQLEQIIKNAPNAKWRVTGSSLGGFFATYLASKYDIKAVLINPAVKPYELLEDVIGEQTNPYTNEVYMVTYEHMQQLQSFDITEFETARFMVMVQTGDEVLDYKQATEKYKDCHLIVQSGGDHSFINFDDMLNDIVKFLELENNAKY